MDQNRRSMNVMVLQWNHRRTSDLTNGPLNELVLAVRNRLLIQSDRLAEMNQMHLEYCLLVVNHRFQHLEYYWNHLGLDLQILGSILDFVDRSLNNRRCLHCFRIRLELSYNQIDSTKHKRDALDWKWFHLDKGNWKLCSERKYGILDIELQHRHNSRAMVGFCNRMMFLEFRYKWDNRHLVYPEWQSSRRCPLRSNWNHLIRRSFDHRSQIDRDFRHFECLDHRMMHRCRCLPIDLKFKTYSL